MNMQLRDIHMDVLMTAAAPNVNNDQGLPHSPTSIPTTNTQTLNPTFLIQRNEFYEEFLQFVDSFNTWNLRVNNDNPDDDNNDWPSMAETSTPTQVLLQTKDDPRNENFPFAQLSFTENNNAHADAAAHNDNDCINANHDNDDCDVDCNDDDQTNVDGNQGLVSNSTHLNVNHVTIDPLYPCFDDEPYDYQSKLNEINEACAWMDQFLQMG